jgi:hypothetical protein
VACWPCLAPCSQSAQSPQRLNWEAFEETPRHLCQLDSTEPLQTQSPDWSSSVPQDHPKSLRKPWLSWERQLLRRSVAVNGRLLPNSAPRPFDTKTRAVEHWPFGTYRVSPGTAWLESGTLRCGSPQPIRAGKEDKTLYGSDGFAQSVRLSLNIARGFGKLLYTKHLPRHERRKDKYEDRVTQDVVENPTRERSACSRQPGETFRLFEISRLDSRRAEKHPMRSCSPRRPFSTSDSGASLQFAPAVLRVRMDS